MSETLETSFLLESKLTYFWDIFGKCVLFMITLFSELPVSMIFRNMLVVWLKLLIEKIHTNIFEDIQK